MIRDERRRVDERATPPRLAWVRITKLSPDHGGARSSPLARDDDRLEARSSRRRCGPSRRLRGIPCGAGAVLLLRLRFQAHLRYNGRRGCRARRARGSPLHQNATRARRPEHKGARGWARRADDAELARPPRLRPLCREEEEALTHKEEHEHELRHELPDLLRRAVEREVRRRQEPDGYE